MRNIIAKRLLYIRYQRIVAFLPRNRFRDSQSKFFSSERAARRPAVSVPPPAGARDFDSCTGVRGTNLRDVCVRVDAGRESCFGGDTGALLGAACEPVRAGDIAIGG